MNGERLSLNGAFKISFLLHLIVCLIVGLAVQAWMPFVAEEQLMEVSWAEPDEESEALPQETPLPEKRLREPSTKAAAAAPHQLAEPSSSAPAAPPARMSAGLPPNSAGEELGGGEQKDSGGSLDEGAAVFSDAKGVSVEANFIGAPQPAGVSASERAAAVEVFLTRVEQRKKYPYIAMKRHLEGRPVIHVELDAAGNLVSLFVNSSSGADSLDQAALEAVQKACPYAHQLGVELVMDIPVRYELSEG